MKRVLTRAATGAAFLGAVVSPFSNVHAEPQLRSAAMFERVDRDLSPQEWRIIVGFFQKMYASSRIHEIDGARFRGGKLHLVMAKKTGVFQGFAFYCGSVNDLTEPSGDHAAAFDMFAVHLNIENGKVVSVLHGDIAEISLENMRQFHRLYGEDCDGDSGKSADN